MSAAPPRHPDLGNTREGVSGGIRPAAGWLATPEYQCSRIELQVAKDGRVWRMPLPCRTWGCPRCARKLRHGVMSLAASGRPNRMLTLTCAPLAEPDPSKARDLLHKTWRALRLKIAREFAKPASERWHVAAPGGRRRRPGVPTGHSGPTARSAPAALPYFAVVEKHKSGRPHLHILLRCEFIPQRWISGEMARRAQSPICDIRKVANTKVAASYVAKYIGKAPAKFGNSRAYWYTRNWAPPVADEEPEATTQVSFFSARPRRWSETVEEVAMQSPIIDVTPDGWFSMSPHAAPFRPIVVSGRYGSVRDRPPRPPPAADAADPDATASRW